MMQNVYVMSHASDIDGVGSAALIKRKFNLSEDRLFFAVYSNESIRYVDEHLRESYRSGITLFITDLGVNDSIAGAYLSIIRKVKENGGKVYWFDHHPWTKKSERMLTPLCEIAIIGENKKYCATEITRKELGLSDGFTRRFIRLVHHSDFNIRPRSTSEYQTIGAYALSITLYNTSNSVDTITGRLRHIAGVISKGRFLDARIRADARRFNRINEGRTRAMVKNLEIKEHVAIGFSRQIQSTYACAAIMKASKKAIGIYVNFENGRGHIRSESSDISALARALGGGGHPHAAGFDIDTRKFGGLRTDKDRSFFADFMEKKIAEIVI